MNTKLDIDEHVLQCAACATYDLGNGFSVQEVTDTAASVTGRAIAVVDAPRRDGNPARLMAHSTVARRIPGWQPTRDTLKSKFEDVWRWKSNH